MRRFLITTSALLTTFLFIVCLSRADDSSNSQPKNSVQTDLPKEFQFRRVERGKTGSAPSAAKSAHTGTESSPGQVVIKATLLAVDNKKLQEANIDLHKTVRFFSKEGDKKNVLTRDAAEGLMKLLKASGKASVLAAPHIRTFSGRSAHLTTDRLRPVSILRKTDSG